MHQATNDAEMQSVHITETDHVGTLMPGLLNVSAMRAASVTSAESARETRRVAHKSPSVTMRLIVQAVRCQVARKRPRKASHSAAIVVRFSATNISCAPNKADR